MLKRIIVLQALSLCFLNLNAQTTNNIKLAVEPGFLLFSDSGNLGVFLNIEPKLRITGNTFMGLRIGLVLNPQRFDIDDPLLFRVDEGHDNGGISFVPTLDYFFREKMIIGRFFHPYLGLGAGVYVATRFIDVFPNGTMERTEVLIKEQAGIMVRGGAESQRLRVGVEYNFVQKADIKIPTGQTIGTVDNSYFGMYIGFVVGAGKV